jgi:(p)ppGpp synthase/HD superfamily hydrolase
MTYDLSKAIRIAQKAHEGQKCMFDYYGRKDFYYEHPHKVMNLVRKSEPDSDRIKYAMVGILHDVIEDSDYTLDDLRKESIPEDIITAVDLLTHKKGITYSDYLIPLKENELSRRVKMADMLINASFFFRKNHESKMKKYIDGIKFLMKGESNE